MSFYFALYNLGLIPSRYKKKQYLSLKLMKLQIWKNWHTLEYWWGQISILGFFLKSTIC